jgi:hypothetical protein
MKRLMISATVAVGALVAATALRSHPRSDDPAAGATMPLQDLQTAAMRNYLPSQDFEDMSLVYPTRPGR